MVKLVAVKYASINLSQPLDGRPSVYLSDFSIVVRWCVYFMPYLTFSRSFYPPFTIKIEGEMKASKPRNDMHADFICQKTWKWKVKNRFSI